MRDAQPFVQTVTRNFLKLGLGELIARVIGFLTVIYIARRLEVEAYGVVGFAQAVLLYFAGLADFGIEALGPREIANKPDRAQHFILPILAARLLITVGLVLVLVLVGLSVPQQPEGLVLALFAFTLFAVSGSTRWIHVGLEQTGRVAVARTVGEVIRALVILLLVHEAADVVNVPLAHIVGETLAAVLLIAWLRPNSVALRPPIDWSVVKPIFRRSWPLAASTLLGLLIYNADLIFLRYFRDAADVGYYLAAFTLINLIGNLGTTYGLSLLPTLTRAGQTDSHPTESHQYDLFQTAMAHVAAVALPLAAGGYLLSADIIGLFFGASYASSAPVLQILILSIPFLLLRSVLQAALITAKRQDRIMWITFWSAALNIALNLLIIPRYGMTGAALTTVATEIIRMVLNHVYATASGFPTAGFRRYWRSGTATLAMAGVLWMAAPASLWISLLLGGVVYVLALTGLGGIRFAKGALPALTV